MHWLLFIILQALSGSLTEDPGENNTVEEELFFKQIEMPATIFPVCVMRESSNDIKVDGFKEYVNRIKKKGVELIKDTARQIMWEVNKDINITKTVDTIMIDYEQKIENYANINYLSGVRSPPIAESLYMFLDVLNTAYIHLYKEQTKVYKDVLNESNCTNTSATDNGPNAVTLHGIVFKQCLSFKKKELLHMCNNYQICRPYSAFPRYLMHFLYEILSLRDIEFKAFIVLLKEVINNDDDFLMLIAGKENIIKVMDKLFLDPDSIKESLEVLKALLRYRYKIIHIPDLKRQRKIQAVRVLLDIIDRTLSFGHNEEISFDVDKTRKAINDWSKGLVLEKEDDYIMDISEFVNSIFRTLTLYENALIPSLIETIITSKLEQPEAYKGLFQDGSKNVYAGESTNQYI